MKPKRVAGTVRWGARSRVQISMAAEMSRRGQRWEIIITGYRVFLRDQDGNIIGRDDFDARDDLRAMFIARALCDACSDRAASCELRQGFRVVDKRFPMRTVNLSVEHLASTLRKIIFERQVALLKSRWAIADSPRLREQTARMIPG